MNTPTMRTTIIPIWLSRTNHEYAHAGVYNSALLWNELVEWVRAEWAGGRHPNKASIEKYADTLKTYPLHSHTIQAVAHDLWDAIETSRTNRQNGMRVRAPHRHKNYRPLVFTKNFGWRVTPEGKLNLSFGQGKGKGSRRKSIILPLPQVVDARTGVSVPPTLWGEILLCWDRHNRVWSLHIPYHTSVNNLPQAKPSTSGIFPDNTILVAVDPGIINPMTLSHHDTTTNSVEALVITGREIRSIKRGRNKRVGSIQAARAKCKTGSRKDKRLALREKQAKGKANRQLHNANHHVAKRASDWIREQAVDKTTGEVRPVRLTVGDVRGIEQKTKKQRRTSRSTRQQLSQWERGTQERYLMEKTGLEIEYVPEQYTTQKCPACPTRRKVQGREYKCNGCGLVLPRDVVGSGNIGSRALYGGTKLVPWVDDDTRVIVTYQRALRGWSPLQTVLHGWHQQVLSRAGKPAVVVQNRARSVSIPVARVGETKQVATSSLMRARGREPNVVSTTQLSVLALEAPLHMGRGGSQTIFLPNNQVKSF